MSVTARNLLRGGRVLALAAIISAAWLNSASAEILYESGVLGPTGLARGEAPGATVGADVFNGVRFQLTDPVKVERVGGHFVGSPGTTGTFFGAIVELDDANDLPNSGDLSTSDVLGTTILSFPAPSTQVLGELSVSLAPGWYALVFGSGLFGAAGDGAMPLNNPDIGMPSYIGYQPGAGVGWRPLLNPIFRNYRFLVEGQIVPEPASTARFIGFLFAFSNARSRINK